MTDIYIDRKLSESLHSIGVEKDSMLFCDGADLFDGLNGSDLVVGEHDGDQDGIRTDSLLQLVEFYNTVLIHIQVGDLKTAFLQILAGMKDSVMLDLACDDVFSFGSVGFSGSF